MEEKVCKVMKGVGSWNIVLGIISIVVGVASGILLIVSGAKLLSGKSKILFQKEWVGISIVMWECPFGVKFTE